MKIFNFSAGPSMVPPPVMKKVQEEFRNYNSMGIGITELSHRTEEFAAIIDKTESNIREIMGINDNYAVCFVQGGASLQFAMIPMNLMSTGIAEYADSGYWSEKALIEAKKFGEIKILGSSKDTNYDRIPSVRKWKLSSNSSYIHITTNNTVYGTQYHAIPEMVGHAPLIADMSTDIMSRNIDVNNFGLIYASAQKVLGATGLAIVIIRRDLIERSEGKNLPTMLDYSTYVYEKSMHNTPPTFSIYFLMLVTNWLKEQGGMNAMEKINTLKSQTMYERIDASPFYTNFVVPSHRSRVNVVFRTPSKVLDEKFVTDAEKEGLIGLRGHRAVEGLRASMYNSMPLEGVEKLIDFMNEFELENS